MTPSALHLGCAATAALCGAVVLAQLGAPAHYAAVNVAALIGGAVLGAALLRTGAVWPSGRAVIAVLCGASLVATALWGVAVDGAVRWVAFGGLVMQPGFLAAPIVLLSFARRRDGWSIAAVALTALGFALQPDRALAGALLVALLVLAVRLRNTPTICAAAMAAAAFATTLWRPDVVPPSPFVEGVVTSAFAAEAWIGAVAVLGLAALIAPFVVGASLGVRGLPAPSAAEPRSTLAMLGAFWAATIVASLIGHYPTPFIGYGASAILGYGVSALLAGERLRRDDAHTKVR